MFISMMKLKSPVLTIYILLSNIIRTCIFVYIQSYSVPKIQIRKNYAYIQTTYKEINSAVGRIRPGAFKTVTFM